MKITDVRACQPATPDSPPDWRTSLGQILVAIDTDSGLTAYGVGGGGFAGIHIVRTVLRDLLVGRDPADVESLSREMLEHTLAYGQKGIVIMAISGVDLALWDLRGHSEGVSISDLLGGAKATALPTYITVWDNEALAEAIQAGAGHQGFKLHLGAPGGNDRTTSAFADRTAAQIHQARAIIGPDRELMVDAWMKWDLVTAKAFLDRVIDCGLSWLEEPLPVTDETGYAVLAVESQVPIAGGEHEFTAASFERLIERRLHTVLQPDVCWCGGLTELVRIYEMGNAANIRVCPHRGSEIWALPAIAALDPQPLAESGRPWMTWVTGQPPIEHGQIQVPTGPGFGIEIDESALTTLSTPVYDMTSVS
jgi:L-rhamnonate dehydratase